jgi:hypothetical protein
VKSSFAKAGQEVDARAGDRVIRGRVVELPVRKA